MHLFTRIALLMALGLVARCSAVLDAISQDRQAALALREGNRIYQERETNRDARRIKGSRTNFDLIDELLGIVIDFDSSNCTMGGCISQKQCGAANGTEAPDVRCAGGFGVCCITSDGVTTTEEPPTATDKPYEGGNTTIDGDGGPFFNNSDSFEPPRRFNLRQDNCEIITATIEPGPDAVQLMVDIKNLNIMGPLDGDCDNDTLAITGANYGLKIPILCGNITNQILHIGIDNPDGPITISLSMCNVVGPREWYIYINILDAGDARLAPPRCLQYFTETTGTVTSFNFEGSPPMMLNDEIYSICFKYISGFCDIVFDFARFDLGNIGGPRNARRNGTGPADVDCDDEFVIIGTRKICGDYIDMSSVTGNASTVIGMDVVSSGINDIQAEGFNGTYMMMPCGGSNEQLLFW